eukprot:5019860-Heterocapsa_arctica.AAC.1
MLIENPRGKESVCRLLSEGRGPGFLQSISPLRGCCDNPNSAIRERATSDTRENKSLVIG